MQTVTQGNFEELIEIHKYRIYRICRVYAVSPIEPEDLFQEVVFQIWKSHPTFKGQSNIGTWIYRIAINVCIRSKMKFQKSNTKTIHLESITFSQLKSNDENEDQERFELLRECISQLNESDRSIVVLYLEDLPYKDMVSILGLTENHIAVKMKRIRKKLLNCMTPKMN